MDIDTIAARELVLFVDNSESHYKVKMAAFRALAKKKDRGTYDARLAPKIFLPLLTNAAKAYVRENGSPQDKWHLIFSPIDRRHAALRLVEEFQAWYQVDYQALTTKR